MNRVAENLRSVHSQIDPKKVRVLAVTKKQPLSTVREAMEAGLTLFGNNYAQEGKELMQGISGATLEWHFIGHIQSRKVKELLNYHCIQSLDRIEVALSFERLLADKEKRISALVEVNLGEENQKSGVLIKDLPHFLKQLSSLKRVSINGLMGMPPNLNDPEARRPFFRSLKRLYDQFSGEFPFHTLSMGTSDDFHVAAQEGSNLIRLGTVLLGARPGL